jgi:hypothetical protein
VPIFAGTPCAAELPLDGGYADSTKSSVTNAIIALDQVAARRSNAISVMTVTMVL